MDVLHVSQPTVDGVARVVADLADAQAADGLDVGVACPLGAGPLADMITERRVARINWEAQRSPFKGFPREYAALRALLTTHRPKVVHLHSAKAGLVGRAIPSRSFTIYQPHAWSFWAAQGKTRRASELWEANASRRTDRIIYVCDEERHAGQLIGVAPKSSRTIPNGVDVERFKPRDRTAARQELGLPLDRTLIVCVGRVCEQKGQDLLLDEWPTVRAALPDAELVLVGDGIDKPALVARNTHGVIWRDAADPAPYFNAADIVVVPSRWEVIGLVTMEAMASGAAVVAAPFSGSEYALGRTDTIVNPAVRGKLTELLCDLFKDERHLQRIRRVMRHRAVNVHSHRVSLKAHQDNLFSILGRKLPAQTTPAPAAIPAQRQPQPARRPAAPFIPTQRTAATAPDSTEVTDA